MSGGRCWRIAAASAPGTSHAKLGIPCQDAHVVNLFPDRNGKNVLVVVVSDGAGSAAKAEAGSWLTCSSVAEAAQAYLINGKVSDISRDVALSWVGIVQQAVDTRAKEDNGVAKDYACTMLVAIVGEDAAAFLQVGDGATVVSDDEGWCWVHWPQHGEFANMTNFVTEPNAEEKLAFDLCPRRIDEVAVFSDGIERLVLHESSKSVFDPFFDRMFPAVRSLDRDGLNCKLSASLENYLNSEIINDKTDDDKTLVLATRRSPSPPEPVNQPTDAALKVD